MAKNVIALTVTIDKQQAQQMIDEMKVSLKAMKDELSVVQNKLNDRDLWGPKDTFEGLKSQQKSLEKQIKLTEKAITNGVRELEGYEKELGKLSELNYNKLTQMRTAYTNSLKNIKRETEEELKVYEEKANTLQAIRDEIAKRDIDVRGTMTTGKAAEVMASPKDYSTTEINQAIEATRKLRDMQQTGSTEWHNYNTQIEAAKKFLDDFNASVRQTSMEKQFVQLPTISDQALKDQKSYWQAMVSGAQQGSKELAEYESKLKEVDLVFYLCVA